MNRFLVAGLAVVLAMGFVVQESSAGFLNKCGGKSECGGGLLSNLGSRCGGRQPRCRQPRERGCGGGLLAKLKARKSCCGEPAPACETSCAPSCEPACAPAPSCGCEAPAPSCGCEAPAPSCGCEAPAPSCGCEAPAPSCGCEAPAPSCGCSAPVVASGCDSCGTMSYDSGMVYGTVVDSGCANCSQTMDAGSIIESSTPVPPAPVADPAADASASDAAPEASCKQNCSSICISVAPWKCQS